jgi:hypothetical protein
MRTAPALVLCLSDPERYLDRYAEPDKGWTDRDPGRWPVPYWDVDTGMAALLMLLGAVDAGLAAASSASRRTGRRTRWRPSASRRTAASSASSASATPHRTAARRP